MLFLYKLDDYHIIIINIKKLVWNMVPLSEKYALTIKEAADYFNIGEKKIRAIISSDPQASFLLHNGNKILIKRAKFENYLNCRIII